MRDMKNGSSCDVAGSETRMPRVYMFVIFTWRFLSNVARFETVLLIAITECADNLSYTSDNDELSTAVNRIHWKIVLDGEVVDC